MTIPPARDQSTTCDVPESSHRFNATIQDDNQRMIVNTERSTWHVQSTDSRIWKWEKKKIICTEVRHDHDEPIVIVLRQHLANGALGLTTTKSASQASQVSAGDSNEVQRASSPASSSGTGMQSTGNDVNAPDSLVEQMDAVLNSGHFSALPAAKTTLLGGLQQPRLSIKNQTAYELTVLLAGPVERSVLIVPGGSQAVALPPGSYRILGQVKVSNVLPFYGTQVCSSGSSYEESFYIK